MGIIFMLFANALLLPAQTLIHASHSGTEESFGLEGINNRTFYITKTTDLPGCCAHSLKLVGRKDGKIAFEQFLMPTHFMLDPFLAVTADKHLLVAVGSMLKSCDVGPNNYQISKIDTTGNVAWQFQLQYVRVTALLPWPDTSFFALLIPGNKLRHYDSKGQNFTELTLSTGSISSICRLNNGHILLCQASSGWVLREIDSTGIILNNYPISGPLKNMMQSADGNIYGLAGSTLRKFSPTGNLLCSTGTLSPPPDVTSYFLRNDSVFVTSSNPSYVPSYLILDQGFNVLHLASTNLENATPAGVYVDKRNKVNVVSTGPRSYHLSNTFTGYFQTELAGHLNGRFDVGITAVDMIMNSFVLEFNQLNCTAEATLTIKNFGPDTVKSFHVNHYGTFSTLCRHFNGFNQLVQYPLPPGGTVAVPTGIFRTHAYIMNGGTIPPDSLSYCFFTTVPNEENDIDVTNDMKCKKIAVTDVKELSEPIGFRIFPNPALNSVTISCAKEITELVVTDCLGRSRLKRLPRSTEVSLDLDQLSNGIYIVQVITTYGTLQNKLVVDGK